MPKFKTTQDLKNYIQTGEALPDFKEFKTLLTQSSSIAGYEGIKAPQDGAIQEYIALFPNAFEKFNEENLKDDEFCEPEGTGDYYLKNYLNPMAEKLRSPADNPLYNYYLAGVKKLEENEPGSIKKFYSCLQKIDKYFDLNLKIEELDPDYAKYINGADAEQEKIIVEPEKNAGKKAVKKAAAPLDPAKERSWLNYDIHHRPGEGVELSESRKKDWLAKRMVASAAVIHDNEEGAEKIPFSTKKARMEAEKLQKTWAFKHLTVFEQDTNEYLGRGQLDLAQTWQNIQRPYADLTLEERKAKIESLYNMAKDWMMKPEGRSAKYRNMYNSIVQAHEKVHTLQDSNDPALNGEKELENIFDKTEKYMKGKKSMRSKPDEQCRFDQSVDIIVLLGRDSRGGKLMSEGLIDRINTVRAGKNQRLVDSSNYGGEKDFEVHSNARRLELLANKAKQAALKKGAVQQEQPEANQNMQKEAEGAKVTMLKIVDYSLAYLSEEKRKLPPYEGPADKFNDKPQNYHFAHMWSTYEKYNFDEHNINTLKNLIAGTLASKDTPLYYNKDLDKAGVNSDVFDEKFKKYLKDPVVSKMAEKLKTPEQRHALFGDTIQMTANLKTDELNKIYEASKKEVEAKGPVL